MAVRFIIGRAGTGKTHHCLEAIRARLREDPIEGSRLILLVPEQASLQMERAIIQAEGVGGAHRLEVVSFRRLALRGLEGSGAPVHMALSESARVMVVRHLLIRQASRLRYYRRVARQSRAVSPLGGFVDRLSATIAELIQEAVEPHELASLGDRVEHRFGTDATSAKLHDLHLIYSAYLDYLGGERLDPSQFLQVARDRFARCPWLHGANLWVDGFASLAGQETMTLVALARLCRHVDVTAMAEPSSPEPRALARASVAQAEARGSGARLFARTYKTFRDLERAFLEAGVQVENPLLMSPDPPPRFAASGSLARLERALFTPGGRHGPAEAAVSDRGPAAAPPQPSPVGIDLVELPSRRIEVNYAVARICRWVQDPATHYRYRDVAIIVRDLEPYHDLLTQALDTRGVPFFIDRRRPIAHHPFVELLRGAAAMAADDFSIESVRLALKTDLLGIPVDSADELENYLIAHGLEGLDTWRGDDWSFPLGSTLAQREQELDAYATRTLGRINKTRRTLLQRMDTWFDCAGGSSTLTGQAWAAAVIQWLDRLGVARTLKRWADQAEWDGDLDQAEEHRQVWRDVMSFLDDLAFAFSDEKLSAGDRADVLEAGLSGLTLGLAPPMIDQVLVGSIDRSRHPDLKGVVILGFNDGVFPRRVSEDSILNDDDREALASAGVRIGPPSRERALDESLLVYTALTRASEALVVTYALTDNDGKALRVSPYVDALTDALPGLTPAVVGDPVRLRETWDVLCFPDVTERLAMEFRTRPALSEDDRQLRGLWNELYDCVRANLDRSAAARRALASLDERGEARIPPASVERLLGGPLRTSVSGLETYAACPFQYFARYHLKLRERAQATLEPVDVGQIHHLVLQDFVEQLSLRRQGFAQLSEGELLAGLGESCSRVATRLPSGEALGEARNAYVLSRSARYLARVLRAQRKVSQGGTYRPRAAEVPFGFDQTHRDATVRERDILRSLPALELSTPAGRRVLLRGYIDRVDLAELSDELLGIVIDYKSTPDKRLDLSRVYHGLSLQLLGYLLVLAECGQSLAGRPVRPGGALYVSLAGRYELVDHPDLVGKREQALPGTFRPRGIIRADRFEAMDEATEGAGWSSLYAVHRKADGSLGHIDRSDAADPRSFQAMLEHTRYKLGQLADGILDGDVAVRPYRLGNFSPCSWCPVKPACRFEMGLTEVRFLETLNRSEVFRRMTETRP